MGRSMERGRTLRRVAHPDQTLNRTAISATLHCLTGCAIGEVLGLVIATAAGWGDAASIAISIALAFVFGYALTMVPLLRVRADAGRRAAAGARLRHAEHRDDGAARLADRARDPGRDGRRASATCCSGAAWRARCSSRSGRRSRSTAG